MDVLILLKEPKDVPRHPLVEIDHFFHTYKDLEGKRVKMRGWEDRSGAYRTILDSIVRYTTRYR